MNKAKVLLLFFLLLNGLSFGQLSNFTLSVTAVNETCPGNGRLNFSVSNATPGGTIIFTVYKFPDVTTPIVTTQATTFTGLVAANYRVVVTESLPNGTTNTRQRDIVVVDRIESMQLNFQKEDQTCIHRGSITVATIRGRPVSYEIISGPIIVATQTSNVFTGLTNGTYAVRVFDDCGESITQNVVIENIELVMTFGQNILSPVSCNLLNDSVIITGQDEIHYPVTVQWTVYEPNGNVNVSTQIINSGNPDSLTLSQTIPFYYGQMYRYKITVTDVCGNVFNSGDKNLNPQMEVLANVGLVDCSKKSLQLNINNIGIAPFTVSFLNSPAGFDPTLFNSSHPNFNSNFISFFNPSESLPAGNYDVQVTDSCGRTDSVVFTVNNIIPPPAVIVSQLKGCGVGFSTLSITTNNVLYDIVSAQMELAPSSYPFSLPLNLSSAIFDGKLFLTDLTSGTYKFKVTDSCGAVHDISVQVVGYQTTANTVNVIEECSSFKIDLQNTSNIPSGLITFWLQKYNPYTNQWVHPLTGMYSGGTLNSVNAISLNNNSVNSAVSTVGKFRVMKMFFSYKLPTSTDPSTTNYCFEEIKNFEFNLTPGIKNIYSFSCNNNSYQVIVEAEGTAPFRYEIISRNGSPFYIDNANASIFNSLTAGIYSFKVTDFCGNSNSRLFEVSGNVILPVMATSFCNGSVGSLSVPDFSYLQYEWWKDNATSDILSNTNALTFTPFNFSTNAGIYHVRITNPGNPNTCINFVLDYTIQNSLEEPNAGNDSETTICGTHGVIDLNVLLSANHDGNGTWSEISNSGVVLANGVWDSTTVMAGLYSFQYKVDGLCDRDDTATIKINLKNQPQRPNAFSDSNVCMHGELHLYASTVYGATYLWVGPNGFTSNDQNPVILNVNSSMQGVYTVKTILDGCESLPATTEVIVGDFSDFQMKTWCGGNKKIKVDFIDPVVNANLYEYNWIYPDGNSYLGGQHIDVAGQTGTYSVQVTNSNGCVVQKSIEINCTFCGIPKGVSANDDGDNDNFDLSCIDHIRNVKIYNRYGILIFEKENYTNEWKGYDKNEQLLPTGTYYYLITLEDGEAKSGWVYLNY